MEWVGPAMCGKPHLYGTDKTRQGVSISSINKVWPYATAHDLVCQVLLNFH